MKKLIQISLIMILVVMAFQFSIGNSSVESAQTSTDASTSLSGIATIPLDGAQVAVVVCRTGIRYCAIPHVGWNS